MVDLGCVSSKIPWVKFKFSRVKICVVVGYDPNEGDGEERYRILNGMDRTLDRVGNGYRSCILVDLNGWIGESPRDCITGVLKLKERMIMGLCAERGLCVGNTYFKHRSIHRYTRGQDRVKIKSMIDLVLVKRDMLRYVQDVRVVRGMERDLSDRYFVLCKIRLVGA